MAAGKLAGSAASTWLNAFSPPAEAASATTSKPDCMLAPCSGRGTDQPAKPADAALLQRDRADAELGGKTIARAGLQVRLPGERLRGAHHEPDGAREECDAIVLGDVARKRLAHDSVARALQELERRLVRFADAAARVGDQIGIGRELEEFRVALVFPHEQRGLALQLFPHDVEL